MHPQARLWGGRQTLNNQLIGSSEHPLQLDKINKTPGNSEFHRLLHSLDIACHLSGMRRFLNFVKFVDPCHTE